MQGVDSGIGRDPTALKTEKRLTEIKYLLLLPPVADSPFVYAICPSIIHCIPSLSPL